MSERSESKRIGAKQHKNSGRNNKKGDATWRNFVVDFKEVSKSFTLNNLQGLCKKSSITKIV